MINLQTGELIGLQLLFFYSALSELLSFSGSLTGTGRLVVQLQLGHQRLRHDQDIFSSSSHLVSVVPHKVMLMRANNHAAWMSCHVRSASFRCSVVNGCVCATSIGEVVAGRIAFSLNVRAFPDGCSLQPKLLDPCSDLRRMGNMVHCQTSSSPLGVVWLTGASVPRQSGGYCDNWFFMRQCVLPYAHAGRRSFSSSPYNRQSERCS